MKRLQTEEGGYSTRAGEREREREREREGGGETAAPTKSRNLGVIW